MNTQLSSHSPVEVTDRAVCMCTRGLACDSLAPGHALHLIQARLASANAARWADATVVSADTARGTIEIVTLEGAAHTVWNAGGAALEVATGTPVALHRDYDVLAVGRAQYNVARIGDHG